MTEDGCVVVVGGTAGLGMDVARHYAELGLPVVVTGRDVERSQAAAGKIGATAVGLGLDLAEPRTIADRLSGVGPVRHVVLSAIERDDNTAADFDLERATRLVTLKLVGYTEVVHTLLPRMGDGSAIVLFGGMAMDRPYPGSTTISTVNGGISGLVHTLAVELAPIRVNAIHPGIVADSPYWSERPEGVERARSRTPGRRPVRSQDVVGAVAFLLGNESVNGVNLRVDSGWALM